MKTYEAYFKGRELGAIGISYYIKTEVKGFNLEDATVRLYDKYEHIHDLQLTELY